MSESLGDTIDRLHHKVVIRDKRIAELEAKVEYLKDKHQKAMKWGALEEAKYDGAKAENKKLREAAMAYSNNTDHTAKCRFWMNVQQQVSGSPCICGHGALAELLEVEK